MSDKPKITALVACQAQSCAEEYSWPLADVRMWNGRPVCQDCWEGGLVEGHKFDDDGCAVPEWSSLPRVTLADLT